jgi:hypothetical protein
MPDVDQELNDRYQAKIDAGLVGNSGDVAEKRTSEREKRRQERWQAYRDLLKFQGQEVDTNSLNSALQEFASSSQVSQIVSFNKVG